MAPMPKHCRFTVDRGRGVGGGVGRADHRTVLLRGAAAHENHADTHAACSNVHGGAGTTSTSHSHTHTHTMSHGLTLTFGIEATDAVSSTCVGHRLNSRPPAAGSRSLAHYTPSHTRPSPLLLSLPLSRSKDAPRHTRRQVLTSIRSDDLLERPPACISCNKDFFLTICKKKRRESSQKL